MKKIDLLWALQVQFNSNLTVEHIQLYNFCLSNCLWTPNAYRLIVRKVFLFQMLGETSIFTWPSKVPLWQKVKMVFCVTMNMDVSAYILKFKLLKTIRSAMTVWIHVGHLWPKSEMIYLPKKVCLIIIYRNTTHLLDMSRCHKHQQKMIII